MADTNKTTLITLERLSQFKTLMTNYVDAADAKSIKSISYDSTTRKVNFFKTEDGSGTAAFDVTLPSTSEFIEKLAIAGDGETGNKAGDFVVLDANGALAGAGSTIAASKITVADTAGLITATDVEGALAELANASAGGVASKTLHLDDTATTEGTEFSKIYKLYQGANDTDMTKNTLVGTINIPKDMFVQSGLVKTVTTAGEPYAGAAVDDKYIELTLANATNDKLYIPANSLVDIYTPEANATQVQLAISATNEISATIVDGSIDEDALGTDAVTTAKIKNGEVTKAKLASDVQDSLDLADSAIQIADMVATKVVYTPADTENETEAVTVKDALDDIYGALGTGGGVSQQITAAIQALDSATTDAGVAGTSGNGMNAITGLTIVDGKINAFNYTTLGGAALKADDYYMVAGDYEIASSQDIQDLFAAPVVTPSGD